MCLRQRLVLLAALVAGACVGGRRSSATGEGSPDGDADADADADTDPAADPAADPDPDADADADPEADPAPDAGTIPDPVAGISCSNWVCEAASERCCIETAIHHECRPRRFDCPFEWANRECDGPEDCGPGQSCCLDPIDARGPARCRDECLTPAQVPLCHAPDDCPSAGDACCFPPGRPAGFCDAEPSGAVECLP